MGPELSCKPKVLGPVNQMCFYVLLHSPLFHFLKVSNALCYLDAWGNAEFVLNVMCHVRWKGNSHIH